MKTIQITLPKGFMNAAITIDNFLIADNNISEGFNTLKFQLPKGKWSISYATPRMIILRRKPFLFFF